MNWTNLYLVEGLCQTVRKTSCQESIYLSTSPFWSRLCRNLSWIERLSMWDNVKMNVQKLSQDELNHNAWMTKLANNAEKESISNLQSSRVDLQSRDGFTRVFKYKLYLDWAFRSMQRPGYKNKVSWALILLHYTSWNTLHSQPRLTRFHFQMISKKLLSVRSPKESHIGYVA